MRTEKQIFKELAALQQRIRREEQLIKSYTNIHPNAAVRRDAALMAMFKTLNMLVEQEAQLRGELHLLPKPSNKVYDWLNG